ncbi:MAG: hypothetical protein ACOCV2_12105, partial [Persicimonas sp.]
VDLEAAEADGGVCLVLVSRGGRIAPGAGYTCEEPAPFDAADGGQGEHSVALNYQERVDEQPWFSAERGFEPLPGEEARDADGDSGAFISHGPSDAPPDTVEETREDDKRAASEGDTAPRGTRAYVPKRSGGAAVVLRSETVEDRQRRGALVGRRPILVFGSVGDHRIDRIPDQVDEIERFRRIRQKRRRVFGPLDIFDAKFDQDRFQKHPEDVFYQYRIPPGSFGRDAHGRDLDQALPIDRDIEGQIEQSE